MTAVGLRRFTRPAGVAGGPARRCELCGVAIDERHGHLAALEERALRCVCRACYLLFTGRGAAGGRLRAVPDRYLYDPVHRLTDADWDALGIPVTVAFFFTNSALGRVVACYPSPAGAVESLLDLDLWQRLRDHHPLVAAPAADVEAVYVTRTGAGWEAFLVPIDACYRLVGELRRQWRGIDGGDAVRQVMNGFVDELRARSRPLQPAREGIR